MNPSGRVALYLTHPEVAIDPAVPVPDWSLNASGRRRERDLAQRMPGQAIQVISSAERKAVETAEPLAGRADLPLEIRPELHENDRASTGFLPPAEFGQVADTFFADPTRSVRGWERATDAQSRISTAVDRALTRYQGQAVVFTGHGAVGSLLYCAFAGLPIDRKWDQPYPGHWFAFDPHTRQPLTHWAPLETLWRF